uniref:Uncharacterized protein n=1 Tax=Elaeophora elaphi TaxID=1147741 RepID=A0A0R3RMQ5_9BILA
MREVLSSDDGYSERNMLPDTSASTSTTPSFEPHGRSNSTSSMPSVSLIPFVVTGRHRLLPQTPTNSTRRSSTPRFLPTPPSLSSETVTTVSDCSLYNWNYEQRPATTGRRLPQTPIHNDSIRSVTNKRNISVRQQYSITVNSNGDSNTDSGNVIGNICDNEWPSPTITERKFSELRKISQNDNNQLFEYFTC